VGCGRSGVQLAAPDSLVMDVGMACGAERDQVLLGIVAGMAAKFLVVDFQV